MIKIAITGNIGSGKTTICKILKTLGYEIFECDLEIKKLYQTIDLKKKIRKIFDNKISELFFVNGRVNKKALSDYIFNNPKDLRRLEKLIYEKLADLKSIFVKKNKKERIVFFDIPLLFEKRMNKGYDFIIYLKVDVETQKKRVLKRKNIDEEKYKNIISNQQDFSNSNKVSLLIDTKKKKKIIKNELLKFIKEIKFR